MQSQRFAIGMLNVVWLGDQVKLLWATEDGLWLLTKRLERGRFIWPQADGGKVCLSSAQRGQPPDERRRVRQEMSRPLLATLETWLRERQVMLSAKSETAKAIQYALNKWAALVLYCDDGRVEISNILAENALRCVALGRKNFLFAGSDSGGERAATMYSLIGSCKLNDIDPRAYLTYVLERIADHPVNRVDELLPWRVAHALRTISTDISIHN